MEPLPPVLMCGLIIFIMGMQGSLRRVFYMLASAII